MVTVRAAPSAVIASLPNWGVHPALRPFAQSNRPE